MAREGPGGRHQPSRADDEEGAGEHGPESVKEFKHQSLTRPLMLDDALCELLDSWRSATFHFQQTDSHVHLIVPLHRLAFVHDKGPIPGGYHIDHKNYDQFDLTSDNLRLATRTQNGANRRIQKNNTSGFKGVTWAKKQKKWRAQIRFDQINRHIGYFDSKSEAAKAYDAKARELFGEFARLNFPHEEERSCLDSLSEA